MMYIHYCPSCEHIHMLNGHKSICPICEQKLTELSISYMEYIELNLEQRNSLHARLKNPDTVLTEIL